MTQEQINEQIAVIKKVGAEIRQSKETARQFLIDAGIIKADIARMTKAVKK